ncbi:TetR/AcrR family transcriptional regulator [Yinghuangia seranimata]|uniref:TetR/AcrR family transcriptional regulator n=1 Tax=Yinghuangia seranimata TaxID=408067 RepID=UPI00248D3731|nr:TetR/AcrR family transcriptional regulator [Yinghuangia seranimata]MDI2129417.1 TetR/AcrR family transcriptional regulator [Yinghuangia seranimata]
MPNTEPAAKAPGPRRRYPKGEARRAQILRTALEVFAVEGDRKASLRQIADRVGLTATGLTHYFGTREELFLAVIDERDRESTEAAEGVSDSLEAVVRTVEHNMGVPGLVRLYVAMTAAAADPGHRAGPYFARRYAGLHEALSRGLEAMQADGRARADIGADELSRLVIAAIDGLQMQWLVDPSVDMLRVVDGLVTMITSPGSG